MKAVLIGFLLIHVFVFSAQALRPLKEDIADEKTIKEEISYGSKGYKEKKMILPGQEKTSFFQESFAESPHKSRVEKETMTGKKISKAPHGSKTKYAYYVFIIAVVMFFLLRIWVKKGIGKKKNAGK